MKSSIQNSMLSRPQRNLSILFLIAILLSLAVATNVSAAFFESFENSAFPPLGWSKTNTWGGSGWDRLQADISPLPGWIYGTSAVPPTAGAGNYNAYCTWDTGGGATEGYHNSQYLITPGLNGLTATSTISFWLRCSFTNYDDSLRVLISTNRPIPSDFIYTNLVLDFPRAWAPSQFPPFTNVIAHIGTNIPSGTRIYVAFHEWVLDNTKNGRAIELDVISSDLTPDSEVRAVPSSLIFSTYPGDPIPNQVLTYTNIGAAGFTYSNTFPLGGGGNGGITISPTTTGFVDRLQSLAITVAVNSVSFPLGSYSFTNRLTVPFATNSPIDVPIIVSVIKRPQSIAFLNPGSQWTTNHLSLVATAESGLPVLFSVESGSGSITDGSNLTFSASGMVRVVATQPGNGYWDAAIASTQSFTVAKVDSHITFAQIPDQITTNPCLLSASASSGEPVSFTLLDGPALLHFGSFLTFQSAGVVRVVASEPGNAQWNAAPNVTNIFSVSTARAGITLSGLAQSYNGLSHPITATTDPEGLLVTITYAGSATPPVNAGAYRVSGEVNFALYSGLAVDTLIVARAVSTLDFPPIADQPSTNHLVLQASASSGLPVTFTVAGGPASISGQANLTFTGGGRVSIVASQSGDINWAPAPSVTNTFNVTQDSAEVILSHLDYIYDGEPKAATAQTLPTGLSVNIFYDGSLIEPVAAGTYSVSGVVADLQYQGSATGTLRIAKADQTLSFAPLSAQHPTNVIPLQAVASSRLSVAFLISSGPGQLTDGSNLSFTADGVVVVTARQNGNRNWNPAPDGVQTVRVSRLATPGDYNNDGASDLTVYNTNTFEWYSLTPNGTTLVCWAVQWGTSNYMTVPGDYTGNGCNELTVYSPAEGAWYLHELVSPSATWKILWGGPSLMPVWGDYDGDALYDYCVYETGSGNWYISSSTGTAIAFGSNWGGPGLKPVPGDYNGDGLFDLAVYDTASGNWYIRTLDGTLLAWARKWGAPGMIPIPGDYNGDGRSDLAVFNPTSGKWYSSTLSGTILAWDVSFGWNGAIPVPGDYDYDGSSDLSVYNPDNGDWYIFSTRKNKVLVWKRAWGSNGLVPAIK